MAMLKNRASLGCVGNLSGAAIGSTRIQILHSRALVANPRRAVCRASTGDGPVFNDAFKAVLAESLARQGKEILYEEGSGGEEPRLSNQEELLINGINSSRQSLRMLLTQQEQLKGWIERERRQLDRLQTALKLVETDAAYYRGLEFMLKQDKNKSH